MNYYKPQEQSIVTVNRALFQTDIFIALNFVDTHQRQLLCIYSTESNEVEQAEAGKDRFYNHYKPIVKNDVAWFEWNKWLIHIRWNNKSINQITTQESDNKKHVSVQL